MDVQVKFCGSWKNECVEWISGIPCVTVGGFGMKTFLFWRGQTRGDSCVIEWIPISDTMKKWYHEGPEDPFAKEE